MVSEDSHAKLRALNAEYRNIVTNIRLLSALNWPTQAKEVFLASVALPLVCQMRLLKHYCKANTMIWLRPLVVMQRMKCSTGLQLELA